MTARKLVQSKLLDVQMSLRGLLRGFGLKVGPTTPSRFAGRIRDLVEGNATLEVIAGRSSWSMRPCDISIPGVILSQFEMQTSASAQCAFAIYSTLSAINSREGRL